MNRPITICSGQFGDLPLEELCRSMREIGYDGWISLEYERRWQRVDLPDASEGMPKGANYIRGILNAL